MDGLDILSGAASEAAQTASDAVPPVQEHADASKNPPPAKRARKRSKLEKAVDDLATQNVKLNTLSGTLEKVLALVANATTVAQRVCREASANKIKSKLDATTLNVARLNELITDLQKKAEEAVENEKLKRARAELAEENKREMCDEACRTIVSLRLEAQSKMDNKSDKNDNVWDHIAAAYNQRMMSLQLHEHKRSVESLKSKFSREQGTFRMYCNLRVRAKASGADREALGTFLTKKMPSAACAL